MSFLKMVLFDQMSIEQPSLDQHCRLLLQDQGKSFCKQALDKRFNNQAVAFMHCLLEQCLQRQVLSLKLPSAFANPFSAIRLMDSTSFKLPAALASDFPGFGGDGPKSCMQVQFEYDILSGKILDLSMVNALIKESAYAHPLLSNVKPDELIIRDLGYYKIKSFEQIEKQGAYYISRLHPLTKFYERRGDDFVLLDHKTLYHRLKHSSRKHLDLNLFLGKDVKHPVRLVATLLPPEAVEQRRKKKKYRQNAHPEVYNYLVYMNLFITNAPKNLLSVSQVNDLYRVRWQIECIFKTWKSLLKMDKVRKMKADRVRCYMLGKFLWILLNWQMYDLFNRHTLTSKKRLLSIYKFYGIIKDQVNILQEYILRQRKRLSRWLRSQLEVVWRFAMKEDKKGKSLIELLVIR